VHECTTAADTVCPFPSDDDDDADAGQFAAWSCQIYVGATLHSLIKLREMLARLVHYGVDAVLVSTILAGVKRTSGFGYVAFSSAARYVTCVCVGSAPLTL
jgi:hypothetical protein